MNSMERRDHNYYITPVLMSDEISADVIEKHSKTITSYRVIRKIVLTWDQKSKRAAITVIRKEKY